MFKVLYTYPHVINILIQILDYRWLLKEEYNGDYEYKRALAKMFI